MQQVRSIEGTGQAGAKNGSNSNSCAKSAPSRRFRPILSQTRTELDLKMLLGVTIGLTPVHRREQFSSRMCVEDVIGATSALGPVELTTLPGVAENVEFEFQPNSTGDLRAALPWMAAKC